MTQEQKDCLSEIQKLFVAINETVKKYNVEDSFISSLGFINLEDTYISEDGQELANMHLLSSINCQDEDELDEMLSYCVEAYRVQEEEEKEENDPSKIDYWLKRMGSNGSEN